MKANWFAVTIILLAGIIAWSAWPNIHHTLKATTNQTGQITAGYATGRVEFSDTTVTVQIPATVALQELGLGGRTQLGANEGMLFEFDQPQRYRFWMKGMLMPLDFIWIANGQVVDLTPDVGAPSNQASPDLPTYQPAAPVTAVLEVNAGFAARHGLVIGQAVQIDKN